MKNKVFFDKEMGIVNASIIGTLNLQVASYEFDRIKKIVDFELCPKVLIVCMNAVEKEEIFNVYLSAVHLRKVYKTSEIKFAFVKDTNLKLYKFFETTARNRGMNVYVFTNNLSAIEWLNSRQNEI